MEEYDNRAAAAGRLVSSLWVYGAGGDDGDEVNDDGAHDDVAVDWRSVGGRLMMLTMVLLMRWNVAHFQTWYTKPKHK